MMQGGGFEKLQFDKAPSICSTVPMDAVVFKAEQPVVHPKGLKEIPSLHRGNQHTVYCVHIFFFWNGRQ